MVWHLAYEQTYHGERPRVVALLTTNLQNHSRYCREYNETVSGGGGSKIEQIKRMSSIVKEQHYLVANNWSLIWRAINEVQAPTAKVKAIPAKREQQVRR
jgi:hypothetical protein